MTQINIKILDIVEDGLCVDPEDGQNLHNILAENLKQNKKVNLSFEGVEKINIAFLNASIGQLYNEFTPEIILAHLELSNTQDWREVINYYISTSRENRILACIPRPSRKIYIIGSLRNPGIPQVAKAIREAIPFAEVFDDWYAAGPEADDFWKKYEQDRGRSFSKALQGHAAKNVFAFDKRNIDAATDVVLVLPAGKSGHLELGYSIGQGKKGYVLLESDEDRWDVMYQFASGVYYELQDLVKALKGSK